MDSAMKLKYWSLIFSILLICGFVLIIECNSEFNKENVWHKNWHFIHHFQQILNSSEPNQITKNTRRTIHPTAAPGSMADILMVDPEDPSQHPQPPLIFTSEHNPPEPVFGHTDHREDDTIIDPSNNRLTLNRPSEVGAPQSNRQPPFWAKVEPKSAFISISISNITIKKAGQPNKESEAPENSRKIPDYSNDYNKGMYVPTKAQPTIAKPPKKPVKTPEKPKVSPIKEQEYPANPTKYPEKMPEPSKLPPSPIPSPIMHIRVPVIDVKWPVMPNKLPVSHMTKVDKPAKVAEKPEKEKPTKAPKPKPVLEPQPLPPSTKPLEEKKDCVVLGRAGSCFPIFPFRNVFDCFKSGGIVAMDIVRCSWVRACCVPNFFR